MKYDKLPLSFEAQADLLIQRGLASDRPLLINRLQSVNYYRLSGYLYPFRQKDDTYKPGTTFERVWRHYAFDRRLRVIVMDAIERIEVSVRTQLINALSHATGAFGYTNNSALPKLSPEEYGRWLKTITDEVKRSKEEFVQHFLKKYGDSHAHLPLWMAGEVMSFGCMLTMYRGVSPGIKRTIAQYYGVPDEVLSSWLGTLNVIRNICAHHSRLWNRELGFKPKLPNERKYPQWHKPVQILVNAKVSRTALLEQLPHFEDRLIEFFDIQDDEYLICKQDVESRINRAKLSEPERKALLSISQQPHRIFEVLTILRYLLKSIAPQSKWESYLLTLLDHYPEISRWSMGFPDNWKESPLWK